MVGLGYRKDFAREFLESEILKPDFIEVAPENWINVGGFWKKEFKRALEKYPLYTHGLSLSIGAPDPLDKKFLADVKNFLEESGAENYSEHLSYSQCSNAHLYDLLPIPFTQDAIDHVADRVQQVQDILKRPLTLEIVSYYTPLAPEMTELEFVQGVLKKAGCQLLLDVNNIYVNSFNHSYNSKEFIDGLDLNKVSYIHMAGHTQVAPDLIIDTHGEAIIDPVFDLFEYTLEKIGRDVPVLLERDFNIPELEELQQEIERLKSIKQRALKKAEYVA